MLRRQYVAALKLIDQRIRELWLEGYGVDVDVLLERRHALLEQMHREGMR